MATININMKLRSQSKFDLRSGNHVAYRRMDGQTDKVNPLHPIPSPLGGIMIQFINAAPDVKTSISRLCLWRLKYYKLVRYMDVLKAYPIKDV